MMITDRPIGSTIVKARFGLDIRKVIVHHNNDLSYNDLVLMMQRIFRIKSSANVSLKYKDRDGDLITLADDHDLLLALQTESSPISINVLVDNCALSQLKKIETDLENLRNSASDLLDSIRTLDFNSKLMVIESNENVHPADVQRNDAVATIQPSAHEQLDLQELQKAVTELGIPSQSLHQLSAHDEKRNDHHANVPENEINLDQSNENDICKFMDLVPTSDAFPPLSTTSNNTQIGSVPPMQIAGFDHPEQLRIGQTQPSSLPLQENFDENKAYIGQAMQPYQYQYSSHNTAVSEAVLRNSYFSQPVSQPPTIQPASYAASNLQYGVQQVTHVEQTCPPVVMQNSATNVSSSSQFMPAVQPQQHMGVSDVRPGGQPVNLGPALSVMNMMQQRQITPPNVMPSQAGPMLSRPPISSSTMMYQATQGVNPFLRNPRTAHYARPYFVEPH